MTVTSNYSSSSSSRERDRLELRVCRDRASADVIDCAGQNEIVADRCRWMRTRPKRDACAAVEVGRPSVDAAEVPTIERLGW